VDVWALEQVDGPLKLQLSDPCPRTIGRSEECDLHLTGLIWISRQHCVLNATSSGVEVTSNAQADYCVKIDGRNTPTGTTTLLGSGSELQLGDTKFSVIFKCTLQSC
jgi:predicted component of type VI protein secretion system